MAKKNDDIFERMLQMALTQNLEDELADLPSEAEIEEKYPLSAAHEERMQTLFRAEKKTSVYKTVERWSRRVAAIALVAVAALAAVLMTNSTGTATIERAVVEWFDNYATFTSKADSYNPDKEWTVSNISDGYIEAEKNDSMTIYENASGERIYFCALPPNGSLFVNSSNTEYFSHEEPNDGIIYHCFESDSQSNVLWSEEGYLFSVYGDIDVSVLLDIAKSVE